jgi:hypothetical protein
MQAYQQTFVQRDQYRIYVRDHPGAEPTIIAMHGFPDNLHLYDRLLPHLSPPRRVVLAILEVFRLCFRPLYRLFEGDARTPLTFSGRHHLAVSTTGRVSRGPRCRFAGDPANLSHNTGGSGVVWGGRTALMSGVRQIGARQDCKFASLFAMFEPQHRGVGGRS